jgi:hypothetical protein
MQTSWQRTARHSSGSPRAIYAFDKDGGLDDSRAGLPTPRAFGCVDRDSLGVGNWILGVGISYSFFLIVIFFSASASIGRSPVNGTSLVFRT